jgi:hypothetical protein
MLRTNRTLTALDCRDNALDAASFLCLARAIKGERSRVPFVFTPFVASADDVWVVRSRIQQKKAQRDTERAQAAALEDAHAMETRADAQRSETKVSADAADAAALAQDDERRRFPVRRQRKRDGEGLRRVLNSEAADADDDPQRLFVLPDAPESEPELHTLMLGNNHAGDRGGRAMAAALNPLVLSLGDDSGKVVSLASVEAAMGALSAQLEELTDRSDENDTAPAEGAQQMDARRRSKVAAAKRRRGPGAGREPQEDAQVLMQRAKKRREVLRRLTRLQSRFGPLMEQLRSELAVAFSLRTLDLSNCAIGADAAHDPRRLLRAGIGGQAAPVWRDLAEMIQRNRSLSALDLTGNALDGDALAVLDAALAKASDAAAEEKRSAVAAAAAAAGSSRGSYILSLSQRSPRSQPAAAAQPGADSAAVPKTDANEEGSGALCVYVGHAMGDLQARLQAERALVGPLAHQLRAIRDTAESATDAAATPKARLILPMLPKHNSASLAASDRAPHQAARAAQSEQLTERERRMPQQAKQARRQRATQQTPAKPRRA